MTNRKAPLACLSMRQRGHRLTELYPSPIVRRHMADVCENLAVWAGMRGRDVEAKTWIGLAVALHISLTSRKGVR